MKIADHGGLDAGNGSTAFSNQQNLDRRAERVRGTLIQLASRFESDRSQIDHVNIKRQEGLRQPLYRSPHPKAQCRSRVKSKASPCAAPVMVMSGQWMNEQ